MPYLSKATKKCNNGADHSLCLVSFVFLCNLKTIYRVQTFVRTAYKKKNRDNRNKYKHQIPPYISEKIS